MPISQRSSSRLRPQFLQSGSGHSLEGLVPWIDVDAGRLEGGHAENGLGARVRAHYGAADYLTHELDVDDVRDRLLEVSDVGDGLEHPLDGRGDDLGDGGAGHGGGSYTPGPTPSWRASARHRWGSSG